MADGGVGIFVTFAQSITFELKLPFLHRFDVKIPNFSFYGERKQGKVTSLSELGYGPLGSTSGGFAYIRQTKELGRNNRDKDC